MSYFLHAIASKKEIHNFWKTFGIVSQGND